MTVAAAASSNGQVFAVDGSQSTVTGIVFEDTGTGERRPDDPGIAGVLVSNGRDVPASAMKKSSTRLRLMF